MPGGEGRTKQNQLSAERIRTRTDLGRELSALRARSGLSLRQLARQVDAPVATLGDYFAGRHLPGPAQLGLYRSILSACGVSDGPDMEAWIDALARARYASDGRAPKSVAPYRGLEPFRESDNDLFFGRRAAASELLERLRALADDLGPSGGLLVLVGPSGSGKSSLLAAGVVPAVRAGALDDHRHWWDCTIVSGAAGGLAAVVNGATSHISPDGHGPQPARDGSPGGDRARSARRRTLLIVDQFEDVLALPPDSGERRRILEHLAGPPAGGRLVVAALRADFYQSASAEPALLPALRHAQVLLGPMTADELREAIVEPARQVGAVVEEALVELVLADLAPGSPTGYAHDAGALPLLSHVLLATWERAPRNELTVDDYRATSGIKGAISQSAEDLYGSLTPAEQDLTRRIFSRLVRVEGEGPVTRRRIDRQELDGLQLDGLQDGEERPEVEKVLERFVSARLLTADAANITISHDALLSAWPRLAQWIDADRAGLRLHHQISDAANAWLDAGRDEALLWRGSRLDLASEWVTEPGREQQMNRAERDFLAESSAQRDAQQRAARRRTRRTHQLLAAVTILAVAAVVFAAVAVNARDAATQARDQALSRQMAIEAQQLQPTDASLAAQLALAAYRTSPTVQARSALVGVTSGEVPTRLLGPVGPEYVALSGDGRLLAVAQAATDTVALYRLGSSAPVKVAQVRAGPGSNQDFAVAVSPGGQLLASGGTNDAVTLWNVSSPAHPRQIATLGGFKSTVYSVAFSPGGRRVAVADNDGTVRQWNLTDPARPSGPRVLDAPGGAAMKTVAYSPNGKLLAAGGDNGTLAVWSGTGPSPSVASGAGSAAIESVAFNPAGTTLASVGDDLNLRVWSVGPGGRLRMARPPLTVATSQLFSTSFGPQGSSLAVASADGSIHLYDTRSWAVVSSFQTPNPVTTVAFTPGGSLVTADSGGVTRIWSLPSPTTYTESGRVYYLGYVDGNARLVAGSSGPQGDATVWKVAGPTRLADPAQIVPPVGFGPVAGAVAASPNGRVVAVADAQALVQLFDVSDPSRPKVLGPPLSGNKPYIEQLGFSPNGKLLAASDDSGQVRIWDVTDPALPRALPTLTGTKGEVLAFAFSNDSRLIATASTDDHVRLYDVANPEHPVLTATLGGFADYAYGTAFTPDGRILIGCSADGTIRLWDISNLYHPKPVGPPLTGPTGYVYAIAVSPSGHTLAAAITTHAVWVWNIADPAHPKLQETLAAGQAEEFSVTFSNQGHTLAASGSDRILRLWQYRASQAAKTVCALSGNSITPAEWARYVQGERYSPPCRG